MDFDPKIWADEAAFYEEPYPRRAMVGDVRARMLTPSMTRADVIALLGQPTDTPYFADHDLVYWLGPETGIAGMDSQWLVIDFDAAGKFQNAQVATD